MIIGVPRNQSGSYSPFMGKIAFDLLSITGAGNAVNDDKLREVSLQKVGVCQVIGSDMYAFGKTVSAGVQAIDRGSVQGKLEFDPSKIAARVKKPVGVFRFELAQLDAQS